MRTKNSIINIFTGLVGQIVVAIAGFAGRTVFIHVLGSTYLGVSGLFSNILTLLSFAELGIGQAIVFSLYKPIAENDEDKICALMRLYEKAYRFLFFLVLGIGLFILPFLPYIIKDIDSIPNIRTIYCLYVINSAASYLFSYRSTFITASQKNYIINIFYVASTILMTVFQIAGLLLFKNYFVYLGIQIAFGVIQNVFSYIYSSRKYPFLKRKDVPPLPDQEFKSIKKNVGALIIYKIGTLALNSTDNIIISAYVGLIAVGLHSNYVLLTSVVGAFLSTIFGNLTASIGNLNATETTEKRVHIFNVLNFATFWFYSVCSICLFVCMTPFIYAWIGEEYVLPLSVSLIVAINFYIAGMLFAPFNFRQTMGLFVQGRMRPIISAVINIGVSIWFAILWGLPGVLWGTAVARLTTNVWFDPYLIFKKGLNVSPVPYFIDYIKKFLLFLLMGFVCWYVSSKILLTSILGVLIKAIVSFVICNGVILALYSRTSEFRYLKSVLVNIRSIVARKKNDSDSTVEKTQD
ncbi:MAG: sugar translocase [Clostridia bacterium]|nr:sugar translocase [Clostridia bacterium]